MADHGDGDGDGDGAAEIIDENDTHDLRALLSSPERDFLVRNNGDQVKIDSLIRKKVGLYFAASSYGPCQWFTPYLVEVYNELFPNGDFEIVFILADLDDEEDDELFDKYFSTMPWLAVPFSDTDIRDRLVNLFAVNDIPYLVILDENGKVLTDYGVEIIREYGIEAYPFTPKRVKEIKERERLASKEQSLKSLLVSNSRDFLITADGEKVPVSELEGKIVGLYFLWFSYGQSTELTTKLVEVYNELKENGESFEVVIIPLNDEKECFEQGFRSMPWLSLPFYDIRCEKLIKYFELSDAPTMPLLIIGRDGKTLHLDASEAVKDHGVLAYPFTPEKFVELEEIERAKREAQTLESILVSGDLDFVVGKDGAKITVSNLVGKTILLYFSAHSLCCYFTPKLIEAYHAIKAKDDAFEVIFISCDHNKASFDEYFLEMPWLAIPFEDSRKVMLRRIFKVKSVPTLVAIGPSGRTVSTEARDLIIKHGADAYPFTDERLKEIDAEYDSRKNLKRERSSKED